MKLRSKNGATTVEVALILPVLIMLLFGVIEFGFLFYDKTVITNASREGARTGIISRVPRVTIDEISAVVDNYCKNYLITFSASASDPLIEVSPSDTSSLKFGDNLTVKVTYNYTFLLLPNFITKYFGGPPKPGSVSLAATTVMRME